MVLCHSQVQAAQVKTRLAEWLAPRGLVFNQAKTRIVHVDDGFDFLGFNVRRYHGNKLLIKPSRDAIKRVRSRLATEMRALRGTNAGAVLRAVNPIVRGWAAYYRGVVSSEIFSKLDDYLWRLVYKWANRRHPNKSKRWVVTRYFGKFHPARQDRWVFGDRDSGFYLYKFSWTRIVRHQMVPGTASPDDPALATYWNQRHRRSRHPIDRHRAALKTLHAQKGRCGRCGGQLLPVARWPRTPNEWGQWTRTARTAIEQHHAITERDATPDETRLVHPHCHRNNGKPALPNSSVPKGLA